MKRSQANDRVAAALATPVGLLRVSASPRGLCGVDFIGKSTGDAGPIVRAKSSREGRGPAGRHLKQAILQLREYFDGRRRSFDLPLDLSGTAHQQRVWNALRKIPFGRTLSYGALAGRLGSPRAARAVGRACATNPVPVVVPCHRVLGGDGALHGYDGGLWRKRRLLELERAGAA